MLVFLIITLSIMAIGALSYLASARYGLRSSSLDTLPPHYRHLRRKLTKASKAANNDDLPISR